MGRVLYEQHGPCARDRAPSRCIDVFFWRDMAQEASMLRRSEYPSFRERAD
jgi:hypothetical protein